MSCSNAIMFINSCKAYPVHQASHISNQTSLNPFAWPVWCTSHTPKAPSSTFGSLLCIIICSIFLALQINKPSVQFCTSYSFIWSIFNKQKQSFHFLSISLEVLRGWDALSEWGLVDGDEESLARVSALLLFHISREKLLYTTHSV